jgi:hypothetical protein
MSSLFSANSRAGDLEPNWTGATSGCRSTFLDFGEAPPSESQGQTARDSGNHETISRPRLQIPFSEDQVDIRAQIREDVTDIEPLRLQGVHLSRQQVQGIVTDEGNAMLRIASSDGASISAKFFPDGRLAPVFKAHHAPGRRTKCFGNP